VALKGERDPHTGKLTTGHDWNGIKELDTPIPIPVLVFLGLGILFVVVWTALNPAWPTITSYTKGLLGVDQRREVEQSVAEATAEREVWTSRIAAADFAEIEADPALMTIVRQAGATLFGDNCAVCHGTSARGGPGYPNLVEAPTLWGDDAETIAQTISLGINSGHDETRFAQMLAFGRDQMLELSDIRAVVAYVQSLSDPSVADPDGHGAQVFAENCAGCHGEDAKGMTEAGAPDLTDPFWIYGGDAQSIFTTVWGGRQGHMPHWQGRLSPVDIKLLTLYARDLRGAAS
jgi:cytochrome c oxidase cbb3-type subunit 3